MLDSRKHIVAASRRGERKDVHKGALTSAQIAVAIEAQAPGNFASCCRTCRTLWRAPAAWNEMDHMHDLLEAEGWTKDARGFSFCPACSSVSAVKTQAPVVPVPASPLAAQLELLTVEGA